MPMSQGKRLPTSTAHQARLQIYQPTRRPSECTRTIQTPWGIAKITGKLGQGHADFVEAVLRNASAWREVGEGQLQVRVDPHRVRVSMGGGKKASYEQMWSVARDVKRASINLVAALRDRTLRIEGGIIDLVKESSLRVPDPSGTDRALWEVTFNVAYVQLLGKDLQLHYDPLPLARLTTGVAQAIARFVVTHQRQPEGGWRVDNLIDAVGAGETPQARRDRRRELKRDADGLDALGVVLAGDRVFRKRRGANAPLRGANAPSRGASAPSVERTPHGGRTSQAFQA
jgi:hypothetical protein